MGLQFCFCQESAEIYTIVKHTQKYPLCVHVKVLCEMSKSSDPQILEGLPVFPLSPKGLHITVSTTYIEIHQF